jgi:murein L,D-transpeptidase YafK
MKILSIFFSLIFMSFTLPKDDFKTQQLRYERVREAYEHKGTKMLGLLKEKGIAPQHLNLLLRGFKLDQKLEIWAKNQEDKKYQLLITYNFAGTSGKLGPKRKQGDMQIPEGLYHIDRFNPISNFHLSLGVSYPNESDKLLGEKGNLGGDIFIHGSTVTVGCIPLTDEKIEELYILAVEARNAGQNKIEVHLFPTYMDDAGMEKLRKLAYDKDFVEYWSIMKGGKPIDSQKFVSFWEKLRKEAQAQAPQPPKGEF